ncbi:MAG: ribosome maturation factor RimM [Acidimicrobiia bacterium]
MPDEAPERLEVGRIGRPRGLRGDVTVMLVTDRNERMEPGAHLFAGDYTIVVESSRRHRAGWVVHFAGVDDLAGAEALRGLVLSAEPLDAGDDPWVHDLIGCEVRDTAGRALGTVTAVEANPAHDLLVLEGGALIPMPFVVEHTPGLVVIDPPEGLL